MVALSPRQRRLHSQASLHHQNLPLAQWKNPIPPGQNVPTRGCNNCNAVLAFGEAKMLAGWTTKGFAVHWANHFKLHKPLGQQYPPVLSKLIFCCWPDVAIRATTIHSTDPDEEEPDQQITSPQMHRWCNVERWFPIGAARYATHNGSWGGSHQSFHGFQWV